jgi:zinc/manganese transport system substrate-binding protein
MRRCLPVLVVASVAVLAAISAAQAQAAGNGDKLSVVASFSILRDWVRNVAGDRVEVSALVGPGADAHVYAPTPADAKIVGAAKLIVVNGLGFEGWMDRLVQASATRAPVIVASAGVVPRRAGNLGSIRDVAAGVDPHAWHSVHNAKIYVANIRDALIRVDSQEHLAYEANAAGYLQELDRLDADIRRSIATIPLARRKIITTHDAFGYFAADYGVTFIAAQGVSTETEASARDVARIIRLSREQNIPALFFENVVDPRLLRRIAAETGTRIGGTLFSDALTVRTGPAATYVDMMRHNVHEIVDALK